MVMSRRFYLKVAIVALAASSAYGQDLAQRLNTQFRLMQKDANGVITSGSPLVLQKNGFLMYSTSMPNPPQSDAPPPPPPDPALIKIGQTPDEVVAAMGNPKTSWIWAQRRFMSTPTS